MQERGFRVRSRVCSSASGFMAAQRCAAPHMSRTSTKVCDACRRNSATSGSRRRQRSCLAARSRHAAAATVLPAPSHRRETRAAVMHWRTPHSCASCPASPASAHRPHSSSFMRSSSENSSTASSLASCPSHGVALDSVAREPCMAGGGERTCAPIVTRAAAPRACLHAQAPPALTDGWRKASVAGSRCALAATRVMPRSGREHGRPASTVATRSSRPPASRAGAARRLRPCARSPASP
jgi:hypothetical protein